jgi:peptidoglycan/xylan/chitin deacetylase (PgdA/CDA1 family)
VDFNYVSSPADADLILSNTSDSDLPLSLSFYQKLTSEDYGSLHSLADGSYHFASADGRKDVLASIFYLVNCAQEYEVKNFDKYGRFPHADSLQKQQGTLHDNIVQTLMDELFASHQKLSKLNTIKRKSGFFLTHDIDTVYGAKNQNGSYALDHQLWHLIPGLLWRHYLGKADWLNMDKIIEIEAQFGFQSTFYWLVNKDKQNADYKITKPDIQNQINAIAAKGFEIGLHKSLLETSFANELSAIDMPIAGQRYHFLRFNLPQAWSDIEQAGLKLDTSLGYSEDFGFRNSYGLPFMPYNTKEKRVYDLIEVPMNVMDGNFFYHGKTVAQAEKLLIDWLDKNKENAVITINFHNNFFDNMTYAGYEQLYITLLKYFKEEGLTCYTQKKLLEDFYRPELFTPIASSD